MLKVLLPYNYTPAGITSFRKVRQYFHVSQVQLFAVYVPQQLCNIGIGGGNEILPFSDIIEKHFRDLSRLTEYANFNLSFGGVMAHQRDWFKWIEAFDVDVVVNCNSGRDTYQQPFISKKVSKKIEAKTNRTIWFVQDQSFQTQQAPDAFISDAADPFSGAGEIFKSVRENAAHFYFIKQPGKTVVKKSSAPFSRLAEKNVGRTFSKSEVLHTTDPVQSILRIINKRSWNQLYIEMEPSAFKDYLTQVDYIQEQANKRQIQLHVFVPESPQYSYELTIAKAL